ncbi:hypothetical protein CAI21_19200 [Alkalilimnicola ehrlichii]|uniref:hypothetical protein n=1 Tax=Alkalilimnicola ehrlichii TaxID=351052 RepID=UPI000E2FB9F7|nr:hypothetical protein [Alkalilimnicola ehrlichii]RFA25365.1 hypothetical protein CAI21_19200 [Alkalilimnicola ehrlichii]
MKKSALLALFLIGLPLATVKAANEDAAGACTFAQLAYHEDRGLPADTWDDDDVYAYCNDTPYSAEKWTCVLDELDAGESYAEAEAACGLSDSGFDW